MQKMLIVTLAAVLLTAGGLLAQSDADYQGYMKAVAASNGAMGKALAAKNGSMAAAEAEKLVGLFKQVEAFWQARNTADAVNFARQAGAAAGAVAKSASAGSLDQAMADAKGVGPNCGGCHMAHREQTDAGFNIK